MQMREVDPLCAPEIRRRLRLLTVHRYPELLTKESPRHELFNYITDDFHLSFGI